MLTFPLDYPSELYDKTILLNTPQILAVRYRETAGTELETSSLMASFQSDRKYYIGCGYEKKTSMNFSTVSSLNHNINKTGNICLHVQ